MADNSEKSILEVFNIDGNEETNWESEEQRLKSVRTYIKSLQENHILPSWNYESPIQLLPPKLSDVTDRSAVIYARNHQFDSIGFSDHNPLAKTTFYTNPYLTCRWCNYVTFVSVDRLKCQLALTELDEFQQEIIPDWFEKEIIPPCHQCKRCDMYAVGIHDFSEEIEKRDHDRIQLISIKNKSVSMIQRNFRSHLVRSWASMVRQRIVTTDALLFKAATFIQNLGRCRLSKRRRQAEIAINFIRQSHASIIEKATSRSTNNDRFWNCVDRFHCLLKRFGCVSSVPYPGSLNKSLGGVFWYKNPIELRLLYENYTELLERTGYNPSRWHVEMNVDQVAIRVCMLQQYYASRLQMRWRGLLVRRLMNVYRYEVFRCRQIQVQAIFRIQIFWRAWTGRRSHRHTKLIKFTNRMSKEYQDWHQTKLRDFDYKSDSITLTKYYQWERREEETLRMIGRLNMNHYNGRKMVSYSDSAYSSIRPTALQNKLITSKTVDRRADELKEDKRIDKKNELLIAMKKKRGMDSYHKHEHDELCRIGIDNIMHDPSFHKSREKIHDFLSEKKKKKKKSAAYVYPEHVLRKVDRDDDLDDYVKEKYGK